MNDNDIIQTGEFTVSFVCPPVAEVALITQPLWATSALATIVRGYKQVYSVDQPSPEEVDQLLRDINKTKLHTPLEMLSFVWLVRNVTRAFTHQLVRTRVGAAYVQESMRFSDKRHAAVLIPPAIASDQGRLGDYKERVADAFQLYARMIEQGVPIQDARGVLPHNVLTHVFVGYTLSTLAKTASLRYCCQAQAMTADGEGEWKTVLEQMKASLPEQLQAFVAAPWEAGEVSCGFEASFDRPCRFREKFRPAYERLKAKMEPVAEAPIPVTLPSYAPAFPDSILYAHPELLIWVEQDRLVINLSEHTLWDGRSLSLWDDKFIEARNRGATSVWVFIRERQKWYTLSLEKFMIHALYQKAGQGNNSRWLLRIAAFQEVTDGH